MPKSFHLLEEALRSDREGARGAGLGIGRTTVERHISGLDGPRTVVLPEAVPDDRVHGNQPGSDRAGANPPEWSMEQLFRGQSLVMVLDGLQDPGNAGAIARAAEAFGATGLMFVKGTVSPFHPKTLRASAGSLFRVPFVSGSGRPARARLVAAASGGYLSPRCRSPERSRLAGDVDFARQVRHHHRQRRAGRQPMNFTGSREDVAIPTVGGGVAERRGGGVRAAL